MEQLAGFAQGVDLVAGIYKEIVATVGHPEAAALLGWIVPAWKDWMKVFVIDTNFPD
jgi:hypothetical protein